MFIKLCKETGIISKTCTRTDCDLVFAKVKPKGGRKLDWRCFREALQLLAEKRFPKCAKEEGKEAALRKMEDILKASAGPQGQSHKRIDSVPSRATCRASNRCNNRSTQASAPRLLATTSVAHCTSTPLTDNGHTMRLRALILCHRFNCLVHSHWRHEGGLRQIPRRQVDIHRRIQGWRSNEC